jgi:hypothetical protein
MTNPPRAAHIHSVPWWHALQWGSVAEWVGGLATAAAVVYAARSVGIASRSSRDAQADRAWDEARLVTLTFITAAPGNVTKGTVTVDSSVTNGGRRPIHEVELKFRGTDGASIE